MPKLSRREICAVMRINIGRFETDIHKATDLLYREMDQRIDAAHGKLDKWRPFRRKHQPRIITEATLKAIFPERFDAQNEMIKHLERRLKAFDDRFAELSQELARERKMSRERDDVLASEIEKLKVVRKSNAA